MKLWIGLLALATGACSSAAAAPPPANAGKDVVLTANIDKTDITFFLPADTAGVRFVLVNPADKNAGPGSTWGEAARGLGGAQLGLLMENVGGRNNRPAALAKTIAAALEKFAADTGHPELAHAPYFLAGFSKGGGFSATIAQENPGRSIGFGDVCCWVPEPNKDLSAGGLIVIGAKPDGFKMLDAIPKNYDPARAKAAPWTLALQWDCGHDYGNATALLLPYMAAVVEARLPKAAAPYAEAVKLAPLQIEAGWLGDRTKWNAPLAGIAPYGEYKGDKDAAVWLPSKSLAYTWRSFVRQNPPVQLAVKTATGDVQLPPFTAKAKRSIVVPANAPLVVSAEVKPGTKVKSLDYYDGDVKLATVAPDKTEWRWEKVPPGLHALHIEYQLDDGSVSVSNPALVIVSGAAK
ncbi:hypothetical protein [Gemmata sp.]|uniref:hypothetical protein n=1 Tax=Gemmata sp. TaxID=1914242 RepID=UPI003F6F55E6